MHYVTHKHHEGFRSFITGKKIAVAALVVVLIAAGFLIQKKSPVPDNNPVDLINPLMGTDSEFRLSNGNTYPAVAMPWGMNFWTPQTRKMGD